MKLLADVVGCPAAVEEVHVWAEAYVFLEEAYAEDLLYPRPAAVGEGLLEKALCRVEIAERGVADAADDERAGLHLPAAQLQIPPQL